MSFFTSIYESWREIQYEKYSTLELDKRLKGKRVLDAGSSVGFLSDFLQERGCNAEIISVDLDEGALIKCSSESVLGDITNLPFKERCFDAIVCFDVLHLSRTIDLRPLKEGGEMIVGVPKRHENVLLEWIEGKNAEIREINGKEREIVALFTLDS
jgi:2-polyprenyl-3-methyl-5-hydroxy-6-metoxy-1,4-benzoquinol methylase